MFICTNRVFETKALSFCLRDDLIFLVFHVSLVLLSTLKVHRFCCIIYCHKLGIISFTQFIVSSSMSSLITVSLNIEMKYYINIWGRLPLHEH